MTADLPLGIDVQSVKSLLESQTPLLLLDCREPDEYQLARLESAKLIPMGDLPSRLPELAAHKNERVIVHCHHGGRSLRVAHWLRAQGFSRAQSMDGGIDAWSQTIDRSVPRY